MYKSDWRTIPLEPLESELKKKYVNFNCSETYFSLTLKLRLKILQESNASEVFIQPVINQLKLLNDQQLLGKLYSCCLPGCPFRTQNHKNYVKYLKILHNNSRLVCNLKGCKREFLGINQLEIHIKIAHITARSQMSSVKCIQSQLVNQLHKLRCLSSSCNHQVFQTLKDLKKHLNEHFAKKETVLCLFLGCDYEADLADSLRRHCARKHKIQELDNLKPEVVVADAEEHQNQDGGHNLWDGCWRWRGQWILWSYWGRE